MSASLAGQLKAMSFLLLRQVRRRSLRAGEAPQVHGTPIFLLLIVLVGLYFLGFAYSVGLKVAALGHGRLSGIRFLVWSLTGYTFASAFVAHAPQVGRIRPILRSSFLDSLPVRPATRVIVTWLQSGLLSLAAPVALFAAIPMRVPKTLALWVAVSVLGSAAGSIAGQLVVVAARAFAPRMLGRLVPWLGLLLLVVPVWFLLNAATMGPDLGEGQDPAILVALALEGGGRGEKVLAAYVLLIGLAAIGLWAIERRGYDRDDHPVTSRYRKARRRAPERTELVLLWRAGPAKMHLIQCVAMSMLLGAVSMAVLQHARPRAADRRDLGLAMAGIAAQAILFVSMSLFTISGAATTRDLAARPFLSSLPTTPARTLAHKARALRILSLPMFVTLIALAILFTARTSVLGRDLALTYASRVGMLAAGLFILCAVAPSVAFLTRGLGAQDVARQGMPSLLVATLLFLPLLSIALVPSWPQALVALAVLAALGAEARRAGERCVSWIDDPDLTVERDTPTWRALLALGAFFAVQGLAAQAFGFTHLTEGLRLGLVTALGGLALVALSLRARPTALVRSRAPGWDVAGLVAGAASGVLALCFAVLLRRWFPSSTETAPENAAGKVALVAAVIVIAPLCEELFFRGWLQAAIARELPPERRTWSVVFGGLAFAGAHIGTAIVPQLLLGLVAGALFARTGRLRPGMFAHAAHNAVVVLIGGTL